MISIQRVALFVLFDSIERDLVEYLRSIPPENLVLSEEETSKARAILERRGDPLLNSDDPFDLVYGLDLGQKYEILLRNKALLQSEYVQYLKRMREPIFRALPVRNAVMHGRPLTIDEHDIGFAFAQELLKESRRWPILAASYNRYNNNPDELLAKSVGFLDDPVFFGTLNNLPSPDYEDTGFLRRPSLESALKQKILGRYPVITVQGDGGNGKTALTLQTAWNLVESDDHNFDLILWYSAKTSSLTEKGITEIGSAFNESSLIVDEVATWGNGDGTPFEQVIHFLSTNRVLLIIDNLETVTGPYIERLARDFPGESKLVLTSRVPITGDLPIFVPEFTEKESLRYLRTLIAAHSLRALQSCDNDQIERFCRRLMHKPLLIKWFALGVKSGANPEKIIANPDNALRFCLENVIDRLDDNTQAVVTALVSISQQIAPSVIGELTRLTSQQVEDGLAQLTRYGLVEFEDHSNSERTFRLRPFVRSYVVRVVNPDRNVVARTQQHYQRIQSTFEASRAAERFNRYEPRNLVVRTTGESIAAEKIRRLTKSVYRGEYDQLEQGLVELKISDPGYFEIYKFEAFAAYNLSDIPRAIEAYEAALEYAPDQPQVHFYFAGMLMRSGDNDRASEQFATALNLDPEAAPVLREAARNEMRRGNFEVAVNYLRRADLYSGRSIKESLLIIDLWIQYFQRYIDFLVNNGAYHDADHQCQLFLNYLRGANFKLFDRTIIDHLLKVEPAIKAITGDNRIDGTNARMLADWVNQEIFIKKEFGFDDSRFYGSLKRNGRRDTFGFLVTEDHREFFLAAANVSAYTWDWLNNDGAVEFSVRTKADGRSEAFNVTPLERVGAKSSQA